MSSTISSTLGLHRALDLTRQYAMRPRAYALVSGLALIGSFVSVLYYIVDIVGGVSWLILVVIVALLSGTAFARSVLPNRRFGEWLDR